MQIKVFQSHKGDCLLLEGSKGTRLLADGGMLSSYNDHVAKALGELRTNGATIDVVYVSHIDEDHIAGILRMMDDEVGWVVFEHHRKKKNPNATRLKPNNPRPPRVKEVWHNVFHDDEQLNRGDLEDVLIASMRTTLLDKALESNFLAMDSLINSERQALLLQNRLSAQQLGIEVNEPTEGGLMYIGKGGTVKDPIQRKELTITVVGPRKKELEDLRKQWQKWIRKNKETIAEIRRRAHEEADRIHTDEGLSFQHVLKNLAEELGDRSSVTPPNLASLMLLVEDAGKSILLTGDSHPDDIRAGLKAAKRLDKKGFAHFDVIKVPHHGSEFNLDEDFCKKITATHYVFCANGTHDNPDPRIVEMLIQERLAVSGAKGNFKLWFNCSEALAPDAPRRKHMKSIEKLVTKRAKNSQGALKSFFLKKGSSFDLTP